MVVSEATAPPMSKWEIMYLASNPPLEWATIFTFWQPVSSITWQMVCFRAAALFSMAPQAC